MARRIVHQLVDDIDGTVMEPGDGETLHFSVNGVAYEIDVTAANAEEFRAALAPYVAAGRRSAGSPTRSNSGKKRAGGNPEVGNIRVWAAANGFAISDRGRIPAPIIEAYRAAH